MNGDRAPGDHVRLVRIDSFTAITLPCTTNATIHRLGQAELLNDYLSEMHADDLAYVTLDNQTVPVVLASDLPAYAATKR